MRGVPGTAESARVRIHPVPAVGLGLHVPDTAGHPLPECVYGGYVVAPGVGITNPAPLNERPMHFRPRLRSYDAVHRKAVVPLEAFHSGHCLGAEDAVLIYIAVGGIGVIEV